MCVCVCVCVCGCVCTYCCRQAYDYLLTVTVPAFAKKLDEQKSVELNTLSMEMHSCGINVRLLGHVRSLCQTPMVQQVRNIWRAYLSGVLSPVSHSLALALPLFLSCLCLKKQLRHYLRKQLLEP